MFPSPHGPGFQRVLGDHSRARLSTYAGRGEVTLELVPEGREEDARLLRVRPKGSPSLTSTAMRPDRWAMVSGLPARGGQDVFGEFFASVGTVVLYGDEFKRGMDLDTDAASRWMRAARSAVEDMAIHAVGLCEQDALLAARRFPTCMRWWAYTRFVLDPSGRLLQLTESAPGVLIFAFALSESEAFRSLSEELIEGVLGGRALNALLGEVLDGWWEASDAYARTREGAGQLPWLRLRSASPAERERLLADQRLLIRRASPAVPPTLLLLPPPLGFAPEDIPRTTRANARWFRVMKGTLATLATPPGVEPAVQAALSRFASCHVDDLKPPRSAPENAPIRELAQYCIATGRLPSRRTSPVRLFEEVRRWDRRRREFERLRSLEEERRFRESALPDESWLDWEDPRVSIRTLRTVAELIEEGERMHHCVGGFAFAALAGEKILCHVECEGRPYTLELRRVPGVRTLQVTTVLGPCNERPGNEVFRALEPWRVAHDLGLSPSWEQAIEPDQDEVPF